ncbi:hypothetical protein PoB_001439400 [Plakobranchus ocellatus]|uniref:Uncharacterized protein n=1 Tax=Plakobranchus ocellatus TaxID=259542 RepID=A0AAV3Z0G4_9GAST|nr:hypothetical protein PoB_001439400 [Plakobranchus ocellatus]
MLQFSASGFNMQEIIVFSDGANLRASIHDCLQPQPQHVELHTGHSPTVLNINKYCLPLQLDSLLQLSGIPRLVP